MDAAAAQRSSGGDKSELLQRRFHGFADIARAETQKFDARAGEELFDDGARLGDLSPTQARFEVEDGARRRDEEIAGDQCLADAVARRPFEADIGADGAAALGD